MATNPMGPTFDGGEEVVGVNHNGLRYEILFLPDVMNDELQAEGKPANFYWVPRMIRIAQRGEAGKGGVDGDYKFRLIHFVGVQNADTHVGVQGTRETAGGVLGLTTTAAPPLAALESAKQALIARLRGDNRRFWSLRSDVSPRFAPTPVSASRIAISNLSPNADGSVPIDMPTQSGTAAPGSPAPAGAPGAPRTTALGRRTSADLLPSPRVMKLDPDMRYPRDVGGSALDPWFWNLQGQGPGPIDPAAEHAMSGLLGTLPTAILWQGFKGAYSPISVVQSFLIPLWSTNIHLTMTGSWKRVFEHFSANLKGRGWWMEADIKAEFNNLRISGGIKVELLIDGTAPGADRIEQEINKRIDLITQQFTELAKQVIFVPAPQVEAAQAGSGGGGLFGGLFGFGGGLALKWRKDTTDVELRYEETRKFRYNRLHVVSSSLEGFYDVIKQDPEAEKKYFDTLYLDDWDRKVARFVKPVVNWSDPSQKWVGDPVAFLSVQIGYPNTRGSIDWAAHVFQSTDTIDTTRWQMAIARKDAGDVANPPAGWTPDKTFVKRRVHFSEPPSALENPYNRVFVERNVIDLDPGENGTLTNDNTLEVRADSIGVLEVGPLQINVGLEDRTQVVEVEMQSTVPTLDNRERPIVRFDWKFDDQDQPRRWKIFTGDRNFLPQFKYRVRVIVKGSIFSKGMSWTGPWLDGAGNGPLTISVPTPDGEGVTRRLLTEDSNAPSMTMPPPPRLTAGVINSPAPGSVGSPVGGGIGAPPPSQDKTNGDGMVAGVSVKPPEFQTPIKAPPTNTRNDQDFSSNASNGTLDLVGGFHS